MLQILPLNEMIGQKPSNSFISLGANHRLGDIDIDIAFQWRMSGQRHRARAGGGQCKLHGDDGDGEVGGVVGCTTSTMYGQRT